ncbi:MAG TPA: hypothetical protein VFO16_15640 [Pseudonocardiaceae bacterium]|nr:hypothetical protein [Pseudonocardiaceae bacterium]
MLRQLHAKLGDSFVTLDDKDQRAATRDDPAGFPKAGRQPLFIDEVQRAGNELVLAIKAAVDRGLPAPRHAAGPDREQTAPVRHIFAHEAVLDMTPGSDQAAPGAAVTVALCGHWKHEPPCPLAAHHCRAERVGDEVRIRTVFVVEPEREHVVRHRIDTGLATGQLCGPTGLVTRWRLRSSQRSDVLPEETELAEGVRHG